MYFNFKGLSLSRLGKYEDSIIMFDHSIEINPNDANSYYNKGINIYVTY